MPEPTSTADTAEVTPDTQNGKRGWWRSAAIRRYLPGFLVFAVVVIATRVIAPEFFTTNNILSVLRDASVVAIVGVGMTFVILTAGIDLSVGSILALVGVVFAALLSHGTPIVPAILIALALGAAFGLMNGIGVALFGIQPFIMTLATLAIGGGLALVATNGQEQSYTNQSGILTFIGIGGIGRFPGAAVILVAVAVLAWLALRYLSFGRYVYAVGQSPEAARLAGVPTGRVIAVVYVLSGIAAALGGVLTDARLGVGDPNAGGLTNLDAIAAVVIGGTSLMGGSGGVWGTIGGALLLEIVANVLNLKGVSPFDEQIARGVIIIIAVLLTSPEVRARIGEHMRTGRSGVRRARAKRANKLSARRQGLSPRG
jgi:ribose transport system permease protein